jgi:hypothetical protein
MFGTSQKCLGQVKNVWDKSKMFGTSQKCLGQVKNVISVAQTKNGINYLFLVDYFSIKKSQ